MQPRRDGAPVDHRGRPPEGMLVVPEGGGDLEMDMTFVLDGHTTIEHALPVTPLRKDVVTFLAQSGTSYTPTLLVAYGGISGDKWFTRTTSCGRTKGSGSSSRKGSSTRWDAFAGSWPRIPPIGTTSTSPPPPRT
jgi:hypothetical protein